MRLNFATLSAPMQKQVGHRGTGGTPNSDTGFARPTATDKTWDAVGQTPGARINAQAASREASHLSHREENTVGHCKPSICAAVPRVPPVPPQNVKAASVEQSAQESALKPAATSCRTCRHLKRPGLSAGYCGGREDLPPAYGPGHPLRRLPDDRGATCASHTPTE